VVSFRFNPQDTPLVILTEGCFGEPASKTATGVIRYGAWPITAVLDSRHAGKTVLDVTGIPCHTPIVATLAETLQCSPQPKALLIGTAPMGGGLPDAYKIIVLEALQAGLHVINGLHIFLNDLPDIKALADERGVMLWDVRSVAAENIVTRQFSRPPHTKVITMLGHGLRPAGDGEVKLAGEIDGVKMQFHGDPL